MNKTIRILIAIALLAAVLFLARDQIAWAGPGLSLLKAETITEPGTYAIGETCTLRVTQLAEGVSVVAEVLPFSSLGPHPDDIGTYLTGVCHLTYSKSGTEMPNLSPADGDVDVCFAVIGNTDGKIHVYDEQDYTHLDAASEPDLQCAAATMTGKYFLADIPDSGTVLGPVGPAGPSGNAEPGSVRPPPVVVPPIQAPGTYSVGGICTFIIINMADPVTMHAQLLPYSVLGERPESIASYQAGVCKATYTKVGQGVIDLVGPDGTVKVCFAAVPNTTGKIYVYNDKTWTALDTTIEGGLACAPAQQTGKYVLVVEK